MQTIAVRIIALALAVIAAALCWIGWQTAQHGKLPGTDSAYQSVALVNGQLYFGRLEAEGGYLVLRDVFYVQTRQNPDTRAVANVLVKRGAEPHQPDRMLINRQQVLLIEPVKADSQIAGLIAAQNTQPK
jgi:hypothetical protein